MNIDKFKKLLKHKNVKRGTFIFVATEHSICAGYFEAICKTGKNRAFINLAGTRKIKQGRGEDWYDHIYSVSVSRIRKLEVKKWK